MSEVALRSSSVCSLAGASYRQVDYWARTGLVRPSVRRLGGSGHPRLYGLDDLVLVRLVVVLLDQGVSLQRLRTGVSLVREALTETPTGPLWLVLGSGAALVTTELRPSEAAELEQCFTAVDVRRVADAMAEVTEALVGAA